MKISQTGIDLIKKFEGCRLKAYRCAAGVPTIGYGHTAGVRMGQTITQAQADQLLRDDLVKYEQKVMKYDEVYHWSQNQFDALVSFAFNIGNIVQLTANGTRTKAQIADKILAYNKAGGRVLSGLKKRREAERNLFLTISSNNKNTTSTKTSSTKTTTSTKKETVHVQLNYQPNTNYKIVASSLTVRTKPSLKNGKTIVKGKKLSSLKKGSYITNYATMALGKEIWMYIGLDAKGREQWICADTGTKAYVE